MPYCSECENDSRKKAERPSAGWLIGFAAGYDLHADSVAGAVNAVNYLVNGNRRIDWYNRTSAAFSSKF